MLRLQYQFAQFHQWASLNAKIVAQVQRRIDHAHVITHEKKSNNTVFHTLPTVYTHAHIQEENCLREKQVTVNGSAQCNLGRIAVHTK